MNRLDRFRFGNLHKRRFFIVLGIIMALIILSTIILFMLGAFSDRAELVRVKLSSGTTGNYISGVGVNLDYIPTANYVADPSFEAENNYSTYSVSSSDAGCIYIDSGTVSDIPSGSSVRVMTQDPQGVMSCVYSGVVAGFDDMSFGQLTLIEDENGLWQNDNVVKTVLIENIVDALTEDGRLLTDIISGRQEDGGVIDELTFSDIYADANGVYALADDGAFYYSVDGRNFALYSEAPEMGNGSDSVLVGGRILTAGNSVAALLYDGRLLSAGPAGSELVNPAISGKAVAAACQGGKAIFINEDGKLFSTVNFVAYKSYPDLSLPSMVVEDIVVTDSSFYIIYEDGSIAILSENEDGSSYDVNILEAENTGLESGYISAVPYGDDIIAVNSYRVAILIASDGSGIKTLSGESTSVEDIFRCSSGRLLYRNSGRLYVVQILSGIRVMDIIGQDVIKAGDICTVGVFSDPLEHRGAIPAALPASEEDESDEAKIVDPEVEEAEGEIIELTEEDGEDIGSGDINRWLTASGRGTWDIYGEGTVLSTATSEGGIYGNYCAGLTGIGEGYHVISQEITDAGNELFDKETFYRLELRLRQEVGSDVTVKVWLSGEGMNDKGFIADSPDSRFERYSDIFVFSDTIIPESGIRLNIGFEGTGTVYIDNVYLGEDRYASSDIDTSFRSDIVDSNPTAIRLNNLAFGSSGFSSAEFYGNASVSGAALGRNGKLIESCKALETSLRLVRDAESSPWLVIGSGASSSDIFNLIDYLCGFGASDYGKVRIENGTSMPWGMQFDNIFIEINDEDGAFENDMQRGAYVDYVIDIIRQSEYYVDIRDSVIFIDGMRYDGEIQLSSADVHSMGIEVVPSPAAEDGEEAVPRSFMDAVITAYSDAARIAPRQANRGVSNAELISSLSVSFDDQMSAADYISLLFNDKSAFAGMLMLDITPSEYAPEGQASYTDGNNEVALNVISELDIGNQSDYQMFEILDPADETADDTAEAFSANCTVTLIASDDYRYLIAANHSDTQQQFLIDGLGSDSIDSLKRFGADGESVNSNRFGSDRSRVVLQSGMYSIVRID